MKTSSQNGFTLVEIVFIMALLLVFSLGIMSLFRIAMVSESKARFQTQGQNLAQEGIEAVVSIRNAGGTNWDWSTTPVNTSNTEYYQPSILASRWSLGSKLSANPPAPLATPFASYTRIVQIFPVQRSVGCGSTICPIVSVGGTTDVGTRKIVVTVSWLDQGQIQYATVSSLLTHWK